MQIRKRRSSAEFVFAVAAAVALIGSLQGFGAERGSKAHSAGGAGGDKGHAPKGGKGGNDKEKDYVAGSGTAVKNWKPMDFDELKTYLKPVCAYIYDGTTKHNAEARTIESALLSPDVSSEIKLFQCTKAKCDGSDSKGWDPATLASAKDGAVLLLITSDFKQTLTLDINTSKDAMPGAIAAAMKTVLKYEEQLKKERVAKVARPVVPAPAPADKKPDDNRFAEQKAVVKKTINDE